MNHFIFSIDSSTCSELLLAASIIHQVHAPGGQQKIPRKFLEVCCILSPMELLSVFAHILWSAQLLCRTRETMGW